MALYGPNNGFVPFTGFSPTLGADAIAPSTVGNVQFDGVTQNDDQLSYLLFRRANRAARRLMLTLFGAAAGATATEAYSRVAATQALGSVTTNGGLVPIEVVQQINRATTAADITNVTAMLSRSPVVAFPAELSGTSGGGKLGY